MFKMKPVLYCCFLLAFIGATWCRPYALPQIQSNIGSNMNGVIGKFLELQRCVVERIHGPQPDNIPEVTAQNIFLNKFEDILENMLVCWKSIKNGPSDHLIMDTEKEGVKSNIGEKQQIFMKTG